MERHYSTEELEQMVFEPAEPLEQPDWEEEQRTREELESNLREALDAGMPEDFPTLEFELTLENGELLTCEVAGLFEEGEKQYMVLHPKEDTEGLVHILEMVQGEEDELRLLPISDEEEYKRAASRCYELFKEGE